MRLGRRHRLTESVTVAAAEAAVSVARADQIEGNRPPRRLRIGPKAQAPAPTPDRCAGRPSVGATERRVRGDEQRAVRRKLLRAVRGQSLDAQRV